MKIYLLFALAAFCISPAKAEEGGASKDRIGPGKAVVAADEKQGFKLSEKAQKSLNLTFVETRSTRISVPMKALIQFQDFLAIYRLRDGWFRMVEVEPSIQGEVATFNSKEIQPGDQLIIGNGGLLRVVELDVFGPEADACVD